MSTLNKTPLALGYPASLELFTLNDEVVFRIPDGVGGVLPDTRSDDAWPAGVEVQVQYSVNGEDFYEFGSGDVLYVSFLPREVLEVAGVKYLKFIVLDVGAAAAELLEVRVAKADEGRGGPLGARTVGTGPAGATGATGPAGAGLADGDYGDIVISGSVTVLSIDTGVITAAARTVLDDATVAAMVDTLGGASSTGTGGLARATSPTFVTPLLGTPTSGTLTNCSGLPISSGVSGLGANVATFLATPSSANLLAAITDETGTGALVFANSPTLVTPALGTPASGVLTNCTGLPIPAGVVNTDGDLATSINSAACAAAIPSTMWMMLIADYNLANSAAEQKLFDTTANGTLTLPTGVYYFEAFIYILSMSGTSGNLAFDLLGAGTATMDRWGWQATGADNASPLNGNTCGTSGTVTQQSVASVVSATTGTGIQFTVRGMVRISTGGTIIPSGTLANAAAAVMKAGSWIKISRVGTSAETYRGAWT